MKIVGEMTCKKISEVGKGKKKMTIAQMELAIGKSVTMEFRTRFGKDVDVDSLEEGSSYTCEGFTTFDSYKNSEGYDTISETLYLTKCE